MEKISISTICCVWHNPHTQLPKNCYKNYLIKLEIQEQRQYNGHTGGELWFEVP